MNALRTCLFAGALVISAGCSSPSSSPATDLSTPDLTAPPLPLYDFSLPDGDMLSALVTRVSGTLTDSQTAMPLAGAMVCLGQLKNTPQVCTPSGADGTFSLVGVPENADIDLSLNLSGYLTDLVPLATTTEARSGLDVSLLSTASATALGSAAGVTLDATKGQILFTARAAGSPATDAQLDGDGGPVPAPNQDGVTVSLAPAAGQGPFYADAAGVPNASLKATTASGVGAVLNVAAGYYQVTFSHPSLHCALDLGWPGAGASSVALTVVAAEAAVIQVVCR